MKKLTFLLILVVFIGIGSCKKKNADPDFCTRNWATELNDEINAMVTAALTYSSSPTTANCNAYKASINAYLDALEPWGDCSMYASGTNKAQFDAAIADARADLQDACD